MITNLPEWKLTLCTPLYDTASKSPIEMTAQVYGKMRELVNSYNEFASGMSKAISDHIVKTNEDMTEFEKTITCLMSEHIKAVDTKINEQFNLFKEYVDQVEKSVLEYVEENEEIVVGG